VRLALVLVLTATAAADPLPTIDSVHPPAIWVGAPARGASLDLRDQVAWLHVELAARDGGIEMPLDLPAGAKVVGLEINSEHAPVWAEARGERGRGSVEWKGSSGGVDHYVVAAGAQSVIDLALVLPAIELVLDGPRFAVCDGQVATHRRPCAIPADRGVARADLRKHAFAAPDAQSVDADHVILIAAIPTVAIGPPVCSCAPTGPDHHMIRREMKLHRQALRYCYMRDAQYDRSQRDAHFALHFTIEPDGSVGGVSVEGPEAAASCMADIIAAVRFPRGDAPTQVNYPLDIRVTE
jgi:hypothetical protein